MNKNKQIGLDNDLHALLRDLYTGFPTAIMRYTTEQVEYFVTTGFVTHDGCMFSLTRAGHDHIDLHHDD